MGLKHKEQDKKRGKPRNVMKSKQNIVNRDFLYGVWHRQENGCS